MHDRCSSRYVFGESAIHWVGHDCTAIIARLKAELGEFGFDDFQETAQGFRAVCTTPQDPAS